MSDEKAKSETARREEEPLRFWKEWKNFERSLATYGPHYITTYLTERAGSLNGFYAGHTISY